jgi:hypothetical protein
MANSWWVVLKPPSAGSWLGQAIGALTGNDSGLAQVAAIATVVQSATRPAQYYKGPYATQAEALTQANAYNNPSPVSEAEEVINRGPASGSGQEANWSLLVHGISGWFFRGLKVLFGGVLMIVGISRLTGADNKITQLAGKIPVMA